MRLHKIIARLEGSDREIDSVTRTGDAKARQIRCTDGALVNLYDTGTITVQGQHQADVCSLLGLAAAKTTARRDRRDADLHTDDIGSSLRRLEKCLEACLTEVKAMRRSMHGHGGDRN